MRTDCSAHRCRSRVPKQSIQISSDFSNPILVCFWIFCHFQVENFRVGRKNQIMAYPNFKSFYFPTPPSVWSWNKRVGLVKTLTFVEESWFLKIDLIKSRRNENLLSGMNGSRSKAFWERMLKNVIFEKIVIILGSNLVKWERFLDDIKKAKNSLE